MRSVLFVLAIALSAVLLGCQDNTLTGPASNQPSVAGQLARTPTLNGVIPYHVILRDPTQQPNGWIEVDGVITYSLTQEPIMRETRVSLTGINNAKLWPVYGIQKKIWTISCKSSHSCCVPHGGLGEITCHFPIDGRTDGLMLRAHLHVSTENLEIDSLWLEVIHSIPLSGTPKEPYPNSGLVFNVNGIVDYSLVRIYGTVFDLHLMANATLIPLTGNQQSLNLAFSSNWLVSVSEEGVAFLEVRYVFPERHDRLALFITFQITTDNVVVADMWLDFIE